MQESFEFDLKIDEADYVRFSNWRNKSRLKKFTLFWIIFYLIVHIFLYTQYPLTAFLFMVVLDAVIYLIFYLLYSLFIVYYLRYRAKKIYQTDKLLQETYQITINDNGIIEQNENTYVKLSWDKFISIVRNKNYVYLFISKLKVLIIPLKLVDENSFTSFLTRKSQENNIKFISK